MNRLSELNSYSNELVEFLDERDAGVIFDRAVGTNRTITSTENATFSLPIGIEITDIIDYATSLPIVEFDFTTVAFNVSPLVGDVELIFPTLPAHITVTESPGNFFTVSGIRSVSDWDLIKSPTVQPPFGLTGNFSFGVEISYTDDFAATTSKSYTVALTLVDTVYIGNSSNFVYSPTETQTITGVPNIIAELGALNPTWTLVLTPSITSPITNISSSGGTSVTRTFNPTTKTYTLVGDKTNLNLELDNLEIEFSGFNPDFTMRYDLSNNLDAVTEIQFQQFTNNELVCFMQVAASNLILADKLKIAQANLNAVSTFSISDTKFQAYVRFNSYSLANQTDVLLENEDHNTDNQLSITEFVNSALSNVRLEYDLSDCPAGTVLSFDSFPATVSLVLGDRNYFISNIDTIEEFNAVKNALVNLPNNSFQNHSYTINVYYDDPTGNDKTISYTTTLEITPFLLNRNASRVFLSNQGNSIFSNLIVNDYASPSVLSHDYRLTLTVSAGNLNGYPNVYDYGTTMVITGSGSAVNTSVASIKYYSTFNTTSNITCNIKLEYKNPSDSVYTTLIPSYDSTLTYGGVGSIGVNIYSITSSGSFNTFDLGYFLYSGKMDYLIVAGGGGGSSSDGAVAGGGAGGGAGEVLYYSNETVAQVSYSVTIGSGGLGPTGTSFSQISGKDGGDTIFNTHTANKGLGGLPGVNYLGDQYYPNGGNSGSGFIGGDGVIPFSSYYYAGGGGAGSTGDGGNANAVSYRGGTGGSGYSSTITGTNVIYARGGGGAGFVTSQVSYTTPGSGGGGSGSGYSTTGQGGIVIVKMYF
jgi:hypothetical protein